jgi:AP-3 complex subunit mu
MKRTRLFIPILFLNKKRKIIIEKHWRGIISRQIVDVFNDECTKFMHSLPGSMDDNGAGSLSVKESYFTREDVPPILETNKYWLLNVLREDLTWLCPVEREGKMVLYDGKRTVSLI